MAAFLIEIRKGLQEDLLLRILHELQDSSQSTAFQPKPLSVWVNALWFSSLLCSMMGALGILSAKTLARRCIGDPNDSKAFVLELHTYYGTSTEEYERKRKIRESKMVRVDERVDESRLSEFVTRSQIFEWKFRYQVIAVSTLIYLALLLFISGLVILLLNDQRRIGYAVSALTAVIGGIFLVSMVHDLSTEWKMKRIRGSSNLCPTILFWS